MHQISESFPNTTIYSSRQRAAIFPLKVYGKGDEGEQLRDMQCLAEVEINTFIAALLVVGEHVDASAYILDVDVE